MSKQDTHLALLPSGLVDLLPPEAGQEARAITTLMEGFTAFGYARIKPPLVEFEDSLLAPGPGAALAHETFRLMDPVSHRMMGVRSDITPQITRIASSRLAGEPRPLRLAYANDVLRTKGSQQRTERQFCQVGCELIGAQGVEADIESCVLALIGLDALGLKAVTIDLCLPQLVTKIFAAFSVPDSEREDLCDAIERRARDGMDKSKSPAAKILGAIMEAAGNVKDVLAVLKSSAMPDEAKKDIENIERVYAGLNKAIEELGLDVAVSIDPLESRGFEYHRAIGFTLFAKGVRGELGRGGRYDVCFGDKITSETAAGFTLYMDTIRKVLPSAPEKEAVSVPAGESWASIRAMQQAGKIVIRDTNKKGK